MFGCLHATAVCQIFYRFTYDYHKHGLTDLGDQNFRTGFGHKALKIGQN